MYCYSLCSQPCSRRPRPKPSLEISWTPTGKSPVWSLFLSPGSWCTRFCGALQECISQSYVSSGSSMVGLMATSSKRSYAIPTPRAPVPAADHCRPAPPQETLTVLSRSLWGPWVLVHARFVWALWASLVGIGFDSEREFAPPTVLLGLLLCPWTWGISSQLLQHLPSYWGFSNLGLLIIEMLTRTTRKEYVSLWTRSGYYRDMILLTTNYYQLLENISLNQTIQ